MKRNVNRHSGNPAKGGSVQNLKINVIRFIKYIKIYFLISALVIIPGVFSLFKWGLKPSIDFTGGTLLELRLEKQIEITQMKDAIGKQDIEVGSIQTSGQNTYLVKAKSIDKDKNIVIQKNLSEKFGKVDELRYEIVGPTLGRELLDKTFIGAILAIFGILSYVAYSFKNIKFGVSAVLALFHDVIVVTGAFSLLGHFRGVEVDSLFVTAVLTTMSFSVHDTIVVFDRIRESIRRNPSIPFDTQINKAITETMVRSLNNSLTIIFMLLALFLLGGETIKWFVFALLIGTVSGTYSSPFTATPILYLLTLWEKRKR